MAEDPPPNIFPSFEKKPPEDGATGFEAFDIIAAPFAGRDKFIDFSYIESILSALVPNKFPVFAAADAFILLISWLPPYLVYIDFCCIGIDLIC